MVSTEEVVAAAVVERNSAAIHAFVVNELILVFMAPGHSFILYTLVASSFIFVAFRHQVLSLYLLLKFLA